METLEELKAIIAGKPHGATHYSVSEQAYYKFKCECWMWCDKGKSLFSFMQDDDEVCNYLRSLSDIERIIELMEQLNKIEPAKEECKHSSSNASYTHVTCDSCHMIRTDGGWGCASRKWFDNIESAKFYEKNGFLPK